MKLNVLSLFDGISCGRIALEKANINININKYYASEIDESAIKIAKKIILIQVGKKNTSNMHRHIQK